MRVDEDIFVETARRMASGGSGEVGPCSQKTLRWMQDRDLAPAVKSLLSNHVPKAEVWAGAGALYNENQILQWNDTFPEGIDARLLIIGSAANGDHIVLDLVNGAIGYVDHEANWRLKPREHFLPVAPSIGAYLREINMSPASIPDDYWTAARNRTG
jgi:hypothetical protein